MLAPGAALAPRTRLRMAGRIKVGVWLAFRAGWEGDGRSFRWSATAGPFGVPLLRVVDSFAAGRGAMDVRLHGGVRLIHAENADTARSAAGRAAGEAIWTPAALLSAPWRGVARRDRRGDRGQPGMSRPSVRACACSSRPTARFGPRA